MYQNLKTIIILLSLCFTSGGGLFGQDATTELQTDLLSIQNRMDSAKTVAIIVSAEVYSARGGDLISSVNASRYQKGTTYFTDVAGLCVLETETFAVRLDHEEKSLLVLKKIKPKKQLKKESIEMDISTIREMLESESNSNIKISLLSTGDNEKMKKYRVTGMDGIIAMDLILNIEQGSIESMSFEYGSPAVRGQFVQLQYTMIYDQNIDEKLDTSSYFTEENGNITLNSSLSNYTLYTEL